MDAKEIKLALKGIKENLDAKDFKSAIKQCKTVLKSDRNNYLALVFIGVALQETEQRDEAPKAFKKAAEIKPDNNLAWRGIASYYEKFSSPESNEELIRAYERLIVLETESNKYLEFIKKFEELAPTACQSNVFKSLYDALNSMPDEKRSALKLCLLNVYLGCSCAELNECGKKLLAEYAFAEPKINCHLAVCRKYLELLSDEGNYCSIVTDGIRILSNYPQNAHILEIICKAYVELYSHSENSFNLEQSCKEVCSTLLKASPNSYIGLLCKGVIDLQTNEPINALLALKQSIREKPSLGLSWFILCKCHILLYQFIDSQISAQEALKCFKKQQNQEKKLISTCEHWLIQSLSEQDTEEQWLEAVHLGHSYTEKNPDSKKHILPFLANALFKLKRFNECDVILDELQNYEDHQPLVKYYKYCSLRESGELTQSELTTKLEGLVEEFPNFFEAWLKLGRIHYSEGNGPACLSCLLKSAKLNQWCYLSFLHLGHCYKVLLKDLDKARRCYQKAFQLNPVCRETGSSLSEIYGTLGRDDLNTQLLDLVTVQTPKAKWGWFSLGMHYLLTYEYEKAISSLRVANRLDPSDRMVWEILADAYFYHGAHLSAGKFYSKVVEFDPDNLYCRVQVAVVKHMRGEYAESISFFKDIIEENPVHLPALKGHAEVRISNTKKCFTENLNGLAKDNCEEAINSLIKFLETRRDFSCIWKLLGDACVLFSKLPDKYCKLRVSSKLIAESKLRENQKECVFHRMEVLKLALKSYYEVLCYNSASTHSWYDLAVCYNEIANHESVQERRKEMRNLACSAVKKSLVLNEKFWEGWNLLGLIFASQEINDFRLAQHCFIRALEEKDTNAMVWTNLGTLYLCLEDLKLANQAFAEAQRIDFNYVQCWIGQAMVAQMAGHHEAMDLFRHSVQLGTHPENCLGYANMVCRTLLETKNKNDENYIYSIKNMNAVAVACDCMTWYTDRITDNPCAYNMFGLLLERQKRYGESCKAFNSAVSLLMTSPKGQSQSEDDADVLDKVLLNYGRSLINIGKPEEAVIVLTQIRKANFVNQCGLAEAYFKAKKYKEAYSSYATTLEWLAPDSGFKSHILVAMAAVVYMHQGKEDAKILLMQASQLKPPSVEGLFACCALGMLHADLSLSELSLKELSSYRDNLKYVNHVTVFESYIYLLKGEKEKAIRAICKSIHRHPEHASLWLSLSLLLLHLYPNCDSQTAANCAEVTIKLGRSEIDVSKIMSLVSLSNLLSGHGLKSLRSAEKAVHMFPHETENWVVLVASVMSKCLVEKDPSQITWLKKAIAYIRRKLELSKAMSQWLSNNERKVTLMADDPIS